jgi:hypothetical protein
MQFPIPKSDISELPPSRPKNGCKSERAKGGIHFLLKIVVDESRQVSQSVFLLKMQVTAEMQSGCK